MSWKDFIYYQRGQQIAIISLLGLIFLVLISNLLFATRKPSHVIIARNDSLIAAFDAFYNSIEVDTTIFVSDKAYRSGDYRSGTYYSGKGSDEKEFSNQSNKYKSVNKLQYGETIYLNSSDTIDWKKVPGIGSTFASRIVKYRNILGGYVAVEQLLEVYGMDVDRYSNILPFVEVDLGVSKININKLEFKELLKHPYLNYKQVQAITNLRSKKGDIKSINELSILNEFTESDLLRLEPYIDF